MEGGICSGTLAQTSRQVCKLQRGTLPKDLQDVGGASVGVITRGLEKRSPTLLKSLFILGGGLSASYDPFCTTTCKTELYFRL